MTIFKAILAAILMMSAVGFGGLSGDGGTIHNPGGTKPVEIVVAASNSTASMKSSTKYVCDGVDDDLTIKQAIEDNEINSFESYQSCTVYLKGGMFYFGDTLDLGEEYRCIRIVGEGTEVGCGIIAEDNMMKPLIRIGRYASAPTGHRVWLENLYINNFPANKLDVANKTITAVNTGAKTFSVSGDWTSIYTIARPLLVDTSTNRLNDKYYTISDISYVAPNTVITVSETIPSSSASGYAGQHSRSWAISTVAANSITIAGADYTSLITAGDWVRVINSTSGTNDKYYVVASRAFTGGNTVITTTQALTAGLAAQGCVVLDIPIIRAESWGHGGARNCIFEGSLGNGITISNSEFVTIENSLFKHNEFNGIHFAPNISSNYQNANTIQRCMFDETRPVTTSCIQADAYTGLAALQRTQILNNWVKETAGDFVTLGTSCSYNRIHGNTLEKMGSALTDTFYFVRFWSPSGQGCPRYNEVSQNIVYSANTGSAYAAKAFVGFLNYGTTDMTGNDVYNNKFNGNPPHTYLLEGGINWIAGITGIPATPTGFSSTPTEVGRSYNIVTDVFKDVKATALDNVLNITTITNGLFYDPTTTPAVSNPDYPRNLVITLTDAGGTTAAKCTVAIYYLSDKGEPYISSNSLQTGGTQTVTTSVCVSDILAVRVSSVTGIEESDTLTIGVGDIFGLSQKLTSEADLISVSKNGTVLGGRRLLIDGDTRSYLVSGNTINFGKDSASGDLDDVAAGDDFIVRYRTSRSSVE